MVFIYYSRYDNYIKKFLIKIKIIDEIYGLVSYGF